MKWIPSKNDLPCFVTIYLDCHYFLYLIFYGFFSWEFISREFYTPPCPGQDSSMQSQVCFNVFSFVIHISEGFWILREKNLS